MMLQIVQPHLTNLTKALMQTNARERNDQIDWTRIIERKIIAMCSFTYTTYYTHRKLLLKYKRGKFDHNHKHLKLLYPNLFTPLECQKLAIAWAEHSKMKTYITCAYTERNCEPIFTAAYASDIFGAAFLLLHFANYTYPGWVLSAWCIWDMILLRLKVLIRYICLL